MRNHALNCQIENEKKIVYIQQKINQSAISYIKKTINESGLTKEEKLKVIDKLIENMTDKR